MTAKELKGARQYLGLKQRELAEILGIAENSVCRWEIGKHKVPKMAEIIIKQLVEKKVSGE